MDADHRGRVVGIPKAPSAAAIRQLTTDRSLGLGIDITEGEKPENPEKNPRSTGETNYNNSTHTSSTFLENQHNIPMLVTHPAITPSNRAELGIQ